MDRGRDLPQEVFQGRLLKIIAAFSFLLILASLILIRGSVVTGYEISIYGGTPLLAWVFLVMSMCGGVATMIHQAVARSRGNFWLIGFLILLLSNAVILFLPALRGYFFYNDGDPLAHVGMVKDMASQGHFAQGNMYPITHLIAYQIAQVCGVSPAAVFRLLPGMFTLFSMLSLYLLAKIVLRERRAVLLAAAAGITLLYSQLNVSAYPQAEAILFLPIFFYIYFKNLERRDVPSAMLLLVLLFVFPYFHPNTAAMIILFLIVLELSRAFYEAPHPLWRVPSWLGKVSPNAILISTVAFFVWITNYTVFGTTVNSIYSMVAGTYENPMLPGGLRAVRYIGGLGLIQLYLKMYWPVIIYGLLGVIAAIIVLRKIRRGEKEGENLFLTVILFLVAGPLTAFLFFASAQQTVGRFLALNYMMAFAPILVGFLLYQIIGRARGMAQVGAAALVALVIITTSVIGVRGTYRCPYVLQPNPQATYAHIDALNWLLQHDDWGATMASPGMAFAAYSDVTVGPYTEGTREDIVRAVSNYIQDPQLVPSHFGYNWFTVAGSSYSRDMYLMLSQRLSAAMENETLMQKGLYARDLFRRDLNQEDLARLERDPTVNRIYSNGGVDIVYVRASQ